MTQQLTIETAIGANLQRAGQDAMESSDGSFVGILREWARQLSRARGEDGWVTSDDLRAYADQMGLIPSHSNAWGSIFRGPRWVIVGRHRSTIPGNHNREIRKWQYQEVA